jgi:glycosyltransferase involved in cell wall biosynthesis
LDETIRSVLDQDYGNIEYIVLDDGSTDNTPDVLDKYSDRIVWETHPNKGETRTVNKGWAMANGSLIVTVNSDDPLLPGAIRTIVEFMNDNPQILVAYPDWNVIGHDSKILFHRQVPEYDYMLMLKRHYCIVGPGAVMRQTVLDVTGMRDPEFKYVGDFDFWMRAGLQGNFARIPRALATFRFHTDSASVAQRGPVMANECVRLVEKLYARTDLPSEVVAAKREAFAWAHYFAATHVLRKGNLARKHMLQALLYCAASFFSHEYARQITAAWPEGTRGEFESILNVMLPANFVPAGSFLLRKARSMIGVISRQQ